MKTIEDLNISDKHKAQLRAAQKRRSNGLAEKRLIPTIKNLENGMPHFYEREEGSFMHFDFENMVDECRTPDGEIDWPAIQSKTVLFSNPLDIGDYDPKARKKGKSSGGTPPGERIANAGWMVFTFECDEGTRENLEMQLDWFAGKVEVCPFASVHKSLSEFADYRGYSVVFSGNKSLHIHLLFDTRHLDKAQTEGDNKTVKALWTGDVPNSLLGQLYWHVWPKLASIITHGLKANVSFDKRLQSYVQKRRSPWGIRTFNKPKKLHGFLAGDQIEQMVVQERLSQRSLAAAGSAALLTFNTAMSYQAAQRSSPNQPSARSVLSDASQHLVPVLEQYFRDAGWGEYPKPVMIHHDGTHNMLFFKNDAADVHPSTFVRGDYRKLSCAGKAASTSDIFLPYEQTLDETLDLLFQADNSSLCKAPVQQKTISSPLHRFRSKAVDLDTAREYGTPIINSAAASSGVTLIQTAEGLGKTRAMFDSAQDARLDDNAERYNNALSRGEPPTFKKGFIVISTGSYAQLEEKRLELISQDKLNRPSNAVLLRSMGELYKIALSEDPSLEEITTAQAGAGGYISKLHAIHALQPAMFRRMEELRDAAWPLGPNGRVFLHSAFVLMVHDLLMVWPHARYSRAFLHPDFPSDLNDEEITKCGNEMQPYRVIYDEVEWTALIRIESEWRVELAKSIEARCKSNQGPEWDEAGLSARVAAYNTEMNKQGRSPSDVSFEDCDHIIRSKFSDKHKVTVDVSRFPFGKGNDDKNFYAAADGNQYYCKPLRWFHSLQCPVVILTTEDLPRLIVAGINNLNAAKHANSKKKANIDYNHISVIDLTDTPRIFQDNVPIIFDERARAKRPAGKDGKVVESVVELALEQLQGSTDYVISDGLKEVPKPYDGLVMSHHRARGRNDLKSKRIATFITYPAQVLYELLCVIGAAMNIENPMVVAYRDMLFQDLGRNMGFRYTSGQAVDAHVVYIKPSLFRELHQLSSEYVKGAGNPRYKFIRLKSQ